MSLVQANASGTSTETSCTCNTGFLWNADLYLCGLDCTNVIDEHKDGDIGVSVTECACAKGYLWGVNEN